MGDKPPEEKVAKGMKDSSIIFSLSQWENRNSIYYTDFGYKLINTKLNSHIFEDIIDHFVK